MRRSIGSSLILGGCVLLVIDFPRLDPVVVTVMPRHGIHVSDVVGGALVVGGVALMWRR